jgi:hypothetical protein
MLTPQKSPTGIVTQMEEDEDDEEEKEAVRR